MTNVPAPAPPYLGPPFRYTPGSNKPISRIVIHSTVSPCVPGGARSICSYFRSNSAKGSAHYVIDPAEIVQAAYDSVIAWHAPPNQHSIGNEMCDIPGPVPDEPRGSARWKALRRAWRWIKPNQQRMLRKTARLTAQQCLAFDIPIRFLKVDDLRQGKHGITTHANVSLAFGESTHWDPGWWPRRRFMRLVRRYAKQLEEKYR